MSNGLGAIAVLIAILSIAFYLWQFGAARPLTPGTNLPDLSAGWRLGIRAIDVAGTILAVLLLACGIALRKSRAWAGRGLWIWAVAKFFLSAGEGLVGYMAFEDAAARQATQLDFRATLASALAVLLILLGILWGWLFPLVVFLWCTRERARHEARAGNGARL